VAETAEAEAEVVDDGKKIRGGKMRGADEHTVKG